MPSPLYPHDPGGCTPGCVGCAWDALDVEWQVIDLALDARKALDAGHLPHALLDILHEAGMLCDVCEVRIATTPALRHEAQLCDGCLNGEPEDETL